MKQVITRLGPLLKRIFHTNSFTTVGGLLCLLGAVLLACKLIDSTQMLEFLGAGSTIIGLGAKDGIRTDPTVAPESLDAPDVSAGGAGVGTAACLLFVALVGLSACSGLKRAPRTTDPLTSGLVASKFTALDSAATGQPAEALPDSLPPFYLAAPPTGLTTAQVRKFRRAQRQALVESQRRVPAKVRLGKGAAYNAAPDGVAVAQKHAQGPVAAGPQAVATDQSHLGQRANGGLALGGRDVVGSGTGATTPPELTLAQKLARAWGRLWPWAAVVGCTWLAFIPIGSGGLLLPVLAGWFRRRDREKIA